MVLSGLEMERGTDDNSFALGGRGYIHDARRTVRSTARRGTRVEISRTTHCPVRVNSYLAQGSWNRASRLMSSKLAKAQWHLVGYELSWSVGRVLNLLKRHSQNARVQRPILCVLSFADE